MPMPARSGSGAPSAQIVQLTWHARMRMPMPVLLMSTRRTRSWLAALTVGLHLALLLTILYLEQRPGPPLPPLIVVVKILPAHLAPHSPHLP